MKLRDLLSKSGHRVPAPLVGTAAAVFLCLLALGISSGAYASQSKSLQTQVGVRVLAELESPQSTQFRYFLRQETTAPLVNKTFGLALRSSVLFALETDDADHAQTETLLRPDSLYLEFQRDIIRLSAGMQQISWGETFGIPIVDVVNPINFSEPIGAAAQDAKLSVPLVGLELFAGDLYLQGLYSPLKRRSPLPEQLNGIPVAKIPEERWGEDSEFGGRIGYLFGFGLDLKLQYYHHATRMPRFELEVLSEGQPQLFLVEGSQNSYGLSASQSWEAIVLRTDALWESGYLLPGVTSKTTAAAAPLERVQSVDRLQVVTSLDYATESGNAFGVQLQGEHLVESEEEAEIAPSVGSTESGSLLNGEQGNNTKFWAGARVLLRPEGLDWSVDVFGFHGVGPAENADWWVRPMIRWQVLNRMEIMAEANIADGSAGGNSDLFALRRSVSGTVTYQF